MTRNCAELAVVVLSVGAPPELRTALESLQRQSVPLEIVVVNSGGGDPRALLPATGLDVKVVCTTELLWPGAARNAGINASRAPWVAFMASDHVAEDNWAATRLQLHRGGHPAVACAVVNSHPRNLIAWAYHLSILGRRLPGVPSEEAVLYGVSYSRKLFENYGTFREDLRIGEDTEFNSRLAPDEVPVWAPNVRTVHRNPTSLRHMVRSQYARGLRYGLYWSAQTSGSLREQIQKRFTPIRRLSYISVQGTDRIFVVACWPLLYVCATAYVLGVRSGSRQRIARLKGPRTEGLSTTP